MLMMEIVGWKRAIEESLCRGRLNGFTSCLLIGYYQTACYTWVRLISSGSERGQADNLNSGLCAVNTGFALVNFDLNLECETSVK